MGKIREFKTGATRDTDQAKLDYEAFLNPLVLHHFAEYMHKHRFQADGQLRDGDNWQKGMPKWVYMKSAWRHLHDWWAIHRGLIVYKERTAKGEYTHTFIASKCKPAYSKWERVTIEDAICGVLFNAMGYLWEMIRSKGSR